MVGVAQIGLDEARNLVDVGIITIKSEEFGAVLQRFPVQFVTQGKTRYNVSRFKDVTGQTHVVAVVRTSKQGDLSAQATASALVEDLKPKLILLVGIAGASPEREFTLGDVIVANRMYDFNVTAANPDGKTGYATRNSPAHRMAQIVAANLVADLMTYGEWNSEAEIGMARPAVDLKTAKNFSGSTSWKRKVRDALSQ